MVKRLKPLPLEAIVRGYLIGSGWKDYQASGFSLRIELPAGLRQADRLPEVIFTPSSKAAAGQHDENIDFEAIVELVGAPMAEQVRDVSIQIYRFAVEHAANAASSLPTPSSSLAWTRTGSLVLMDEVLTPDSSRFWPEESYRPAPARRVTTSSLSGITWKRWTGTRRPPPPPIPADDRSHRGEYREAFERLTA